MSKSVTKIIIINKTVRHCDITLHYIALANEKSHINGREEEKDKCC